MSSFTIGKNVSGILMTAGSVILLLMLSDFLYRVFILVEDFISSRIHGRERTESLKTIVLSSGLGIGDLSGMNGVLIPLIFGVLVSGFVFYTYGLDEAALPVLNIFLWVMTWACLANCFYHRSFYLHAVLLVKRFFASFVTSQSTEDAMVHSYTELPSGAVKSSARECVRLKSRNVSWDKAVRVFNNGTYGGQILASYLNIFENSNAVITGEIAQSFVDELSEHAEIIITGLSKTRITNFALLAASLMYTGISAWFLYNGNVHGLHMAVLYCSGLILSAVRLLLRNAVVSGRLI